MCSVRVVCLPCRGSVVLCVTVSPEAVLTRRLEVEMSIASRSLAALEALGYDWIDRMGYALEDLVEMQKHAPSVSGAVSEIILEDSGRVDSAVAHIIIEGVRWPVVKGSPMEMFSFYSEDEDEVYKFYVNSDGALYLEADMEDQ